MATSTEKGNALEDEVARLYGLLGGQVTTRVLIAGYEVDVAVRLRLGPVPLSLVVECKNLQAPRKVSDNDVRSFAVKFLAARERGLADKGIILASTGFSKAAVVTANRHGIQCLTLEALRNQLVDFSGYVTGYLADYGRSSLAEWYVPQTGADIEDYTALLSDTEAQMFLHRPLIEFVGACLTETSHVALLGNFGTGKSTFAHALCYYLMQQYSSGVSERLPILVQLADYRPGVDLEQLTLALLRRKYGIAITDQVLAELERMSRLVFILDGLDEMATRVDRSVIAENLREIQRLQERGNSKWLVTCRTHFFQERVADVFPEDYRIFYLVDWGAEELRDYLRRRLGKGWKRVYDALHGSRRLRELARTPQFVDMLLIGMDESQGGLELDALTSIDLYGKYVERWVKKESTRRGAIMDAAQRERFVEFLATRLYMEDRTEIHFTELYEVAREFSGYGDPARLDYFDYDVRTCTFITRNSAGSYAFKHKSFMEFVCARVVKKEIEACAPRLLTIRLAPQEILDFLAEFRVEAQGMDFLANVVRGGSDRAPQRVFFRNCLRIYLGQGGQLDLGTRRRLGLVRDRWSVFRDAIAGGDDEQFAAAFFRVERELVRMIRRLGSGSLHDEYGPEEIVQEVLLKIWSLREKRQIDFEQIVDFRAYLSQSAMQIIADRRRLLARQQMLPLDQVDLSWMLGTNDPSERVRQLELEEIIVRANLSQRERVAVRCSLNGYTAAEVAASMDISISTARGFLVRARRKLANLREAAIGS